MSSEYGMEVKYQLVFRRRTRKLHHQMNMTTTQNPSIQALLLMQSKIEPSVQISLRIEHLGWDIEQKECVKVDNINSVASHLLIHWPSYRKQIMTDDDHN